MRFLIYALTDPRDGQVRYVGQSSRGLARPREHVKPRGPTVTHKDRWVAALLRQGLMYDVSILYQSPTATLLSDAEVFWIAEMKRRGHDLTNGTAGGEGGPRTPEVRKKMSEAKKGKPVSDRCLEGLARYRTEGHPRSVVATEKTAAKLRGRKQTPEALANLREGFRRRRKPTPEEIERSAQAHRGLKRSPETRARMAEAQRRRRAQESPESRARAWITRKAKG